MSFTSWLRNLRSALAPGQMSRKHRRRRTPRTVELRPRLELLEDRCTPSFSPVASYPVGSYPAGGYPMAVLTADFNSDGNLDLAVGNWNNHDGSGNVSVLLGNANGTFGPAVDFATGRGARSLFVGDFTGDGKLDLVAYTLTPNVLLRGNGDGTFQAPIDIGHDGAIVAVADFNGDGKLDLAVTDDYFKVAQVLLGDGNGSFAPQSSHWLSNDWHSSAAVADFNGDGNQDFATTGYQLGTVSVLLGTGTGTLGAAHDFNVGNNPFSVAAGDVNGDGKVDLVTANSGGENVSVLLGNGLGSFAAAQNYPVSGPIAVALSDLNGDGKADLMTANYWGAVSVLLGTGTGIFRPPVTVATGGGVNGLAVGDFNGDSRPDAASANYPDNVSVLLNDGIWPALDAPSIAIGDATVTEGDTETVSAVFTVSLSAAYDRTVSVHYATSEYGSTNESDYQAASGTLIFAPGETSKTVTVLVKGDRLGEGDESFLVRLSDANVFIADGTGLGTILNDEPYIIYIADHVVGVEGEALYVSVWLSAASDEPVTIDYATVDIPWYEAEPYGYVTATAGDDYTPTSGTLTFAPGETSQTITVPLNGDWFYEDNEYFYVYLGSATNANVAWGQSLAEIDGPATDPPLMLAVSDTTVTEGNSGTQAATFTVTLSVPSDQTVTVDYATTDGSATLAGGDYQAASGTLIFAPGETSKTITVAVNGDTLSEPSEYFFINGQYVSGEHFFIYLSNSTNALIDFGQDLGRIVDDDPLPTLAVNDVQVTEGDSGTTNAVFTVSMSAPSGYSVSVYYKTANGTATAGSDYQYQSGQLTFAPGQLNQTVTVLVSGDTLNEANETFAVNLSGPTNAVITDGQGVATILDDEPPEIRISDMSVMEGNSGTRNSTFTVTLSRASGQPVTVNYATANGSAIAGSDYTATSGTLTIPAGQTSGTITVLVNDDRLGEPNETLFVNLSSPTNAIIADGQGVGSIADDEPRISISDVTKAEGTNGQTTLFTFTVTLSAAYDQAVTMSFQTVNGTAKANQGDYIAKTGTLTFAPGETTKTIMIEVKGDSKKEANETFYLDLFYSSINSLFTKNRGLGTILNDD